ncbi:MAG: IS66 family transposase [Thioploca sp.]|nr:IS66 family transposase [Thioploca sp.]
MRALIAMLSVDYNMPLEQISRFFADIFGYKLNRQTSLEVLERGDELLAPLEEPIKATLRSSEVVHFDETKIRVEGQLYWLHTASNAENTHLFLHARRGTEALNSEESVLPNFRGRAVHDCWAPYFSCNQAKPSLGGAHLLRELKGLIEEGRLWAAEMHELLLDVYNMPNSMVAGEEIRKHYLIILDHAEREEPPPQPGNRGRPKPSPRRNRLDRLRTHQDSVLAFALEVGVPFTNNPAERDLRPAKVKLKICGGFRTVEGGVVYARIQALISTLRNRGRNVFSQLRDLFSLCLTSLA